MAELTECSCVYGFHICEKKTLLQSHHCIWHSNIWQRQCRVCVYVYFRKKCKEIDSLTEPHWLNCRQLQNQFSRVNSFKLIHLLLFLRLSYSCANINWCLLTNLIGCGQHRYSRHSPSRWFWSNILQPGEKKDIIIVKNGANTKSSRADLS